MMEEEVEDMVGEVRLTESQKSVATSASLAASAQYSADFTDSSPERRDSSSKDTYVIERSDSSDSDSFPVHADLTVIHLAAEGARRDAAAQCLVGAVSRAAATAPAAGAALHSATQTSRTILQLAHETRRTHTHTLETQTSYVSVTETSSCKIRLRRKRVDHDVVTVLTSALEDHSSKFHPSDSDAFRSDENSSEVSSDDRIINILDAESRDNILSNRSEGSDRSLEPDSLMETEAERSPGAASDVIPKSIDEEIEALYNKLAESRELHRDKRQRALTPLTEESAANTAAREGAPEPAADGRHGDPPDDKDDKDVVFTNFAGGKVKMLPKEEAEFKLPPIGQRSCPSSPHLNFLFSVAGAGGAAGRPAALPCLQEAPERLHRWEVPAEDLAAGESALVTGRGDLMRNSGSIHLPPIHIEGYVVESKISKAEPPEPAEEPPSREAISIRDRIKELKMAKSAKCRVQSRTESRSWSPCSGAEPAGGKLCEVAERGCDALCQELMRRLRSSAWYEVSDTLEEIPAALDKFWSVMSENRIADLIRLVSGCAESPRTQVARAACACLAAILKNTNYTKKPDFNEAMSLLLTKTGSFSRVVRRAANVALDAVACAADTSHAVTALALHGAQHKSGVVRCAAARLLVVCCALGAGGREVLRARPPSAAAARRLALRALADLLDDKNTDARRYAERLYSMLRPLPNFEAYYLTDVEVERASRHMKKYDRSLQPAGAAR